MKYVHSFAVYCVFVVVLFTHIMHGYIAGLGAVSMTA